MVGGHPGQVGNAAGDHGAGRGVNGGPAAGQTGVGGSAAGLGGHPGMAGGGAGQHGSAGPNGGYGGGYAGGGYGGGHPGMVGNGPGGYGGAFGSDGYGGYGTGGYGVPGAPGSARGFSKGDFGAPSIGAWGGPSGDMPSYFGGFESLGELLGFTTPRGHTVRAMDAPVSPGHPGMVGNAAGDRGYAAANRGYAVSSGTANQAGKGNFGGHPGLADNAGSPMGRGGFASIGLALADALAGKISGLANRPGSTHSKNSTNSRGFASARKGDFGSPQSAKGDLGKLGTRMGMPAAQPMAGTRSERGSTHSKGYQGDLAARNAAIAQAVAERSEANRAAMAHRAALARDSNLGPQGRPQRGFGLGPAPVAGIPSSQDPGPRGMPAPPGRASMGPSHSSGIPAPASQDSGFNMRDDFGPIADRVFDGLRQARDAFQGMESRHNFQVGRVGGVGGGRVDPSLLNALGRGANFNDPTYRGR